MAPKRVHRGIGRNNSALLQVQNSTPPLNIVASSTPNTRGIIFNNTSDDETTHSIIRRRSPEGLDMATLLSGNSLTSNSSLTPQNIAIGARISKVAEMKAAEKQAKAVVKSQTQKESIILMENSWASHQCNFELMLQALKKLPEINLGNGEKGCKVASSYKEYAKLNEGQRYKVSIFWHALDERDHMYNTTVLDDLLKTIAEDMKFSSSITSS